MTYSVPKRLIDAVCRHLLDEYLPSSKKRFKRGTAFNRTDLEFFAKGAGALSEAFTTGRGHLPKNYLNLKEFRTGYILYFTVTNYLKSLFCLDAAGLAPKSGARILDIGTGPGTSLLAASDRFRGARLFGIDQNGHILKDAAALIAAYAGLKLNAKQACVTARNLGQLLGRERFDVIFFSNIIGEFRDTAESAAMISAAAEGHLEKGGALIVIEPALQKTTRNLMEVRDLV